MKKMNKTKMDKLLARMTKVIGNAELTEAGDGNILMDAVSEAKVDAIEQTMKIECLKAGYDLEDLI